ncbi:MAG: TetR family transcriptional regulator [Candidatus Limnocylindrales bacterium]|jgi:AcrR family transcriptional regulator
MVRTGRRPRLSPEDGPDGRSGTRTAILAAARAGFAARGYDGASTRAIAAAAGVDAALIHHYFGGKQRLFVAAMELPFDPDLVRRTVIAGPREGLGERLVRFFLAMWEEPARRQILVGMVRSAMTDPEAAAMVRRIVVEGAILPLVAETGVTDSAFRATLVGGQLMGLALARYILCVEPMAGASVDAVVAAIAPTIQRYVTADLGFDAAG